MGRIKQPLRFDPKERKSKTMYHIAKEVIGVGGHKTIEYIEKCLPRTKETESLIKTLNVVRIFQDPFNASIDIVVIK